MIIIHDKEKASKLRRELAAELSKKKPDMDVIRSIRAEIIDNGGRSGVELDGSQKKRRKHASTE